MRIKNIRILNEKHLKDDSKLETLVNSGLKCYASDLARLTGVQYDSATGLGDYWFDGKYNTSKKGQKIINYKNYINMQGIPSSTLKTNFEAGVRIAFSFDDIEDFDLNELEKLEIEYPYCVIGGRAAETLDKLFRKKSKLIISTGKKHYVNGKLYPEYEAFGLRFIRKENSTDGKVLSDGTISKKDKDVYLRVDKVPLTIDRKSRMVYSSIILFGAQFDTNNREFCESDLYNLLNGDFLKSINNELERSKPSLTFSEQAKENNRYGFDFAPLTEEEIIEICINCNVAVFLHGKTGVGKTERMLSLDNTLELVDFGCTSSDGFTGIIAKDFNSRELILYEPYWYKSLCEKCKREPDKIHILFLEELTNAKSDVQKVAFEVTLNKTLTNSGFRLELPENAVVCAAGNEASESRSANQLSEPLFGRFAHVYINTDSEDWLKWALKRKKSGKQLTYKKEEKKDKIHPAIVDYVKVNGDRVLRTPYNGATPNADPRKWALASKALYESNNPNVLRAFIGEELTKDFINFCKINLVTLDDVINDRCSVKDIPVDSSLRWHIAITLSNVDDENVDKVRNFINELGKEYLSVFDYEWSKDNEERIMKLYKQNNPSFSRRLELHGSTYN